MADILVGAPIQADDFPATAHAESATDLTGLSNTSYAFGSPQVGTTFTAPTSGRVLLTVTAGMRDPNGANRVHVSPQVYLGSNTSGTVVLSADVNTRGVGSPAETTGYTFYSRTTLLEGLTPGSTYYAVTMHKVSGGSTGQISYRSIIVEPTT